MGIGQSPGEGAVRQTVETIELFSIRQTVKATYSPPSRPAWAAPVFVARERE